MNLGCDPDEFWWNNVAGPFFFVKDIAFQISASKDVFVTIPADIPYRQCMRVSVGKLFADEFYDEHFFIEEIDVRDMCPGEDPGLYLLNRYGTKETKDKYNGKTKIMNYLLKKEVLKDRIFWIKGLDEEDAARWKELCFSHNNPTFHNGYFILELNDEFDATTLPQHISTVDYFSHITDNDLMIFACSVLYDSEIGYSVAWRNYLSTLVTCLCVTDAEVAEAIVNRVDLTRDDFLDEIKKVAEYFPKRGLNDSSGNLLYYLKHSRKNEAKTEIKNRIWTAQVEYLYPLIEKEKIQILENNKAFFERAMKEFKVWNLHHEEEITELYDLEPKSMTALFNKTAHVVGEDGKVRGLKLKQGNKKKTDFETIETRPDAECYIVNGESRIGIDRKIVDRVVFLKYCRNQIAHGKCCSASEIGKLINSQ